MNTIGLDIGTTTICAVVLDGVTGRVLKSVTADNGAFIASANAYEKIQSPQVILNRCADLAAALTEEFAPVRCIGVTGQMHGILYYDKNGCAISPLYIWQDESGNQTCEPGVTYAQKLSELTGHKMASGFGGTTYFYHQKNGGVPGNTVGFCTIHDYVAMRLAERTVPLVHTSDAASFGLFDLEGLCFDEKAIAKAGLDFSLFPKVTQAFDTVGMYRGVPVAVAIGDNQASFLGSVRDMENSVLVNIGTGGQISYLTDEAGGAGGSALELRPCFDESYIRVGSSLCGGRAFALLEQFLRETAELVTGQSVGSAYPAMDRYLESGLGHDAGLTVSTRFAGTRGAPSARGSVTRIGLDNLTPGNLIVGFLGGMVSELEELYQSGVGSTCGCCADGAHTKIVGSGNGLRKNKALRRMFEARLRMPMYVPAHKEEAAFGAALFGMTAAKLKPSIFEAQKLISYLDSGM